MKLSLKIREEQKHHNPLLRAKIPISVLGLPFISSIVAGDASDLSFSLQSNFVSGPSLKLSYAPSAATAVATSIPSSAAIATPFSLSLKSGVGLFGSPRDSPLTISAHFSLLPNSHHPAFSLQIKPRFGDFSLKKMTHSTSSGNPNPNTRGGDHSSGDDGLGFVNVANPDSNEGFVMHSSGADAFVPLTFSDPNPKSNNQNGLHSNGGNKGGIAPERPSVWRDLRMESCGGKDGLLSGFSVSAKTVLPVMKGVNMNFRWGVNIPAEFGKKMPFLTADKIELERVEEVKELQVKNGVGNVGDMELLKGMCFWMTRDLEALRKENVEMKQTLEKLRLEIPLRNCSRERDCAVKKGSLILNENASDFEQWRANKNGGEENGGSVKSVTRASNVESELERAIKAASP